MENKRYKIQYSTTFIRQLEGILKYFVYNLQNKIAAENFFQEIKKETQKRSENPEKYEKYISNKKRKSTYYKIYVKNYIIFYKVKDDTMILSRILYSKRNFKDLI